MKNQETSGAPEFDFKSAHERTIAAIDEVEKVIVR